MYVVKDNGNNELTDENTEHKLGNIRQSACTTEVDHNENVRCATSFRKDSRHPVTDNPPASADADRTLSCADESTTGNVEVLSHICCTDTPDVTFTGHMNCAELNDACSGTDGMSENTSVDLMCDDLPNNNITLSDSYCGTDSDLVSQSQGLQLTNTQKVKIFAMELEMMKTPVTAHSSQDSLFDSLSDMSAVPMQ